jgi:hypothetical protein
MTSLNTTIYTPECELSRLSYTTCCPENPANYHHILPSGAHQLNDGAVRKTFDNKSIAEPPDACTAASGHSAISAQREKILKIERSYRRHLDHTTLSLRSRTLLHALKPYAVNEKKTTLHHHRDAVACR